MTRRAHMVLYVGLLVIYLILAFSLPTDPSTLKRLSLTQAEARLLNVTVLIPIVITYIMALYGFLRFRSYSRSIEGSTEGPFLSVITTGLMVLVYALPARSIVASIVSYYRHADPTLYTNLYIFRNYLFMLLAVAAFVLLARGAEGLYGTLKRKKSLYVGTKALFIPIILASIFSWLISKFGGPVHVNEFILPAWLEIATLAVPFVYAWSVGVWTVYVLMRYGKQVKGVIYRQAFDRFAKGLAVIILLSILMQFITTLAQQLNRLELSSTLVIVYTLVILHAVGYGLVAKGAGRLKEIEEV